jgi:hypothetical protein
MPDSREPTFITKEYLAGEEFDFTFDMDSDPSAFYKATFKGPEQLEFEHRTTFDTTSSELTYPIGGTGVCVLKGRIPRSAEPGDYVLDRLTSRHRDADARTEVNVPVEDFILLLRVLRERKYPRPAPPKIRGIS